MSKTSKARKAGTVEDERILDEFREGLAGWSRALQAHRLAPPDAGFSARLVELAQAAGEQARVYAAAAPDYEWVPYSAGEPPYELQPDSGRRGPQKHWQHFDQAVARLGAATEGQDMLEVAAAYQDLAAAASALAQAVEREDRAGQRPRARARRSA